MENIIIGIIAYISGVLTGIFAGRIFFDKKMKQGTLNADLVLLVVTVVWGLSMIIDIASPTWETPIAVHGLMGAIVGFFYKSTKKE